MFTKIIVYAGIMFVLLVVMVLFYVFFNLKRVHKQKEHFAQLHQNLVVGKKVIFLNGIRGDLTRVGDETVDIRVKSGEIMEVSRYAISEII